MEEESIQVNILVFGDKNVGKSEFLERFDELGKDTYRSKTGQITQSIVLNTQFGQINIIAVEVQSYNYEEGKFNVKKEVIANSANGVIIIFDINNQRTFKNLKTYVDFVKNNSSIPIVIVGNKADIKNIFQVKQQIEIPSHGMLPYYEMIATCNYNVEKPLIHLIRQHLKLNYIMLTQEIKLKPHQQQINVNELLNFGDLKDQSLSKQYKHFDPKQKINTEENFI